MQLENKTNMYTMLYHPDFPKDPAHRFFIRWVEPEISRHPTIGPELFQTSY